MGGGSKNKDQKEGSTSKNEETICKIIPVKAKKHKLDEDDFVESKETSNDGLSDKMVSRPPPKRAKKFQFKTREY